ncbi:murein L,D-transpeptidase catalytic domain family protein [Ferrimonas gelatinilytica]|uniref:Murein L,D-transpeptidase catalytic domain family protein n=1 Tax=Ferrimonas gelatinilytica TaxID=1255257 RepID=A0ABP9RX75_9GAMM
MLSLRSLCLTLLTLLTFLIPTLSRADSRPAAAINVPKSAQGLDRSNAASAKGQQGSDQLLLARVGLQGRLDPDVFSEALARYRTTPGVSSPILTIIDYSKPSNEKRFFVIDMANEALLYDTFVSHGRQSGALYADTFSNRVSSHQSSLGTFITGETYVGSNGYSLRLDGLDPGVNDNARQRYIVIHGADYADPTRLAHQGMLGRSLGCPALPPQLAKQVIDTIKGGSVIYAHGQA